MTIQEILAKDRPIEQVIADLKEKSIIVPAWNGRNGLRSMYDPSKHPVMSRALYPDVVQDDGSIDRVTRITYDLQRLAVKRMTELCNGIPVQRVCKPEKDNKKQKEVAEALEKLFQRNRIDSVNIERCNMLFAGCEVMTLWYAVEERNTAYGFNSPLKIRCRNFSPMLGDELYPLFDEYGDLIALSVGYARKDGVKTVNFFETYTADHHYKWSNQNNGGWVLTEEEPHNIEKIPGVYMYRPTPIWEDTSKIVYEMEWAMSRNGNYLRKNSKPVFVVFANEQIDFGNEKNETEEAKSVLQFPAGAKAEYVTWQQAVENLKFYVSELRNSFFTQLQLPDWSYEKMSQQAMSGESRKQLFIDAQLKVKDESGRLIEFFDREIQVAKQFLKRAMGEAYHADIDALPVENVITPFTINDEKDTISNLVTATGGKAIMSQREAIAEYGHSENVEQTIAEIQAESEANSFGLTM